MTAGCFSGGGAQLCGSQPNATYGFSIPTLCLRDMPICGAGFNPRGSSVLLAGLRRSRAGLKPCADSPVNQPASGLRPESGGIASQPQAMGLPHLGWFSDPGDGPPRLLAEVPTGPGANGLSAPGAPPIYNRNRETPRARDDLRQFQRHPGVSHPVYWMYTSGTARPFRHGRDQQRGFNVRFQSKRFSEEGDLHGSVALHGRFRLRASRQDIGRSRPWRKRPH